MFMSGSAISTNRSVSIRPCSAPRRPLRRATTPSGCSTTRGSISRYRAATPRAGSSTFGIQAEDPAELGEVYGRLRDAGRPVLEEGATTCCYAKSEKSWVSDPDGIVWEAFHTHGDATVYGESPDLGAVSPEAAPSLCCAPTMPVESATSCNTACGS
jgi:hypothetical protein